MFSNTFRIYLVNQCKLLNRNIHPLFFYDISYSLIKFNSLNRSSTEYVRYYEHTDQLEKTVLFHTVLTVDAI